MSEQLRAWLVGRIPDSLYEGSPEISIDREEVLIVGRLAEPDLEQGASDEAAQAARAGRINRHREDTRRTRMQIASEAESAFGKKVSWGARIGETEAVFTNLSLPVMTRLRMPERQVLDRLVEAGVAGSRSQALAWCVRLVGKNEQQWLGKLKDALAQVEQVRAAGPGV